MTDLLELELSTRSYNVLRRGGIYTVEELKTQKEYELARLTNMGKKSLKEITEKLAEWETKHQQQTQPAEVQNNGDFVNLLFELSKSKLTHLVEEALINSIDFSPYDYTIRRIIKDAVNELIKANKDEIIEQIVIRAAANIQTKALPKLIEKMGA